MCLGAAHASYLQACDEAHQTADKATEYHCDNIENEVVGWPHPNLSITATMWEWLIVDHTPIGRLASVRRRGLVVRSTCTYMYSMQR